MKLAISYRDDEREKVENLIRTVKQVFHIQREHKPKLGTDGLYHAHIKS